MRWILLFLVLVVGVAQSKDEPPKTEGPNQKGATEQRGTEAAPLFVKTPGAATDAERKHEAYEKHEKPWNETALAYATIALAGITLALAVFTALLWCATRKLVIDAKETSKRQLRAYLSVDAAELRDLAIDLKPEGQIRIKNTGATPAYDVTTLIMLTAVKDPFELAGHLKRAVPVGPSQIGPGGALSPTSVIDMAMTQTLLDALTTKSHTLYLHGRIDYTDVFRRPHWTTFRCAQDPDRIGTARLRICSEGNDADRD